MSERSMGDLMIELGDRQYPDDYDAIKDFRNALSELERELLRKSSGRVSLKQVTIQRNWELWHKTTEAAE
jgi:hypothetical protein